MSARFADTSRWPGAEKAATIDASAARRNLFFISRFLQRLYGDVTNLAASGLLKRTPSGAIAHGADRRGEASGAAGERKGRKRDCSWMRARTRCTGSTIFARKRSRTLSSSASPIHLRAAWNQIRRARADNSSGGRSSRERGVIRDDGSSGTCSRSSAAAAGSRPGAAIAMRRTPCGTKVKVALVEAMDDEAAKRSPSTGHRRATLAAIARA